MAIKFLKKEIAQTPNSPESHYNLGWIYMDRCRWKTAAKYFVKSMEMNYRVEDIIGDLAFCYNKSKQITQEIDLYKNYLKSHPNDAWALDNLGASLIDIQEYKKSLSCLKRAKKLKPDDPRIDRNIQRSLDGLREQFEGE